MKMFTTMLKKRVNRIKIYLFLFEIFLNPIVIRESLSSKSKLFFLMKNIMYKKGSIIGKIKYNVDSHFITKTMNVKYI